MMLVYLIRNSVNGKCYVGQTITSLQRRWHKHISDARLKRGCRLLGAAIRKYGENAFELSVVETASVINELNLLEEKFIRKYRTKAPYGYNLSDGGFNRIPSRSTRRKMKLAGKRRWANGYRWSPEAIAKAIASKIKQCRHGVTPTRDCNKCHALWNKASRMRHPGRAEKLARDRYRRDKKNGFCIKCNARACQGMVYCKIHTVENRAKSKRYYSLKHPVRVGHRNRVKTHCKYGHPFTQENTRIHNGERYCRSCERLRSRRRRNCA